MWSVSLLCPGCRLMMLWQGDSGRSPVPHAPADPCCRWGCGMPPSCRASSLRRYCPEPARCTLSHATSSVLLHNASFLFPPPLFFASSSQPSQSDRHGCCFSQAAPSGSKLHQRREKRHQHAQEALQRHTGVCSVSTVSVHSPP